MGRLGCGGVILAFLGTVSTVVIGVLLCFAR